jgi:AraC-like DNA-binding protein
MNDGQTRDKYLQIRVSEHERERIKDIANENGFEHYSEFIRKLALGDLEGVLTSESNNNSVNTFKKGFKIMVKMFNFAMKDKQIKQKVRRHLSDFQGSPTDEYKVIMRLMKGLEGD